jgi:DNA-binding LytR/AlgR family response regulator
MNCIIVDDDKLSRKLIEEFVQKTEGLNLKGSFSSAVDAVNALRKEEAHLIFLDIEMPEMSGMDFMRNLSYQPQIIIISSKDKYALEAFEFDVTDYILKPVTYARYFKAIDKAMSRYKDMLRRKTKNMDETGVEDEIFIKKNSSLVRIKYDDIIWIEALENYVILNSYNDKFTIHFTMKSIEKRLPVARFKRVHRSFIMNITKIVSIEDSSVIVDTANGPITIPIGKSYKEKLMKELNVMFK